MSVKVKDLVKEINAGLTQVTSSNRDEIGVMAALMNDTSFEVDRYGREGKIGTIVPANEFRGMVASVMSSAAKIPSEESKKLIENYEFKKSEAAVLVTFQKDFVNTFLGTGRKLSLGSTETSDLAISRKSIKAGVRTYPKPNGVDSEGKPIWGEGKAHTKAYDSIKVHGSCPSWVK